MKKKPQWVPEVEDIGTAMFQAAQEMLLAMDEVLERDFQFTTEQIKAFNLKMESLLKEAVKHEKAGLSILSPHSMKVVSDILASGGLEKVMDDLVRERLQKEKIFKMGLEVPLKKEATPFLKMSNLEK